MAENSVWYTRQQAQGLPPKNMMAVMSTKAPSDLKHNGIQSSVCLTWLGPEDEILLSKIGCKFLGCGSILCMPILSRTQEWRMYTAVVS